MPKYRVKENNEVRYGRKADPANRLKVLEKEKVAKAGDIIELTKEEAANMAHAVEAVKEAGK